MRLQDKNIQTFIRVAKEIYGNGVRVYLSVLAWTIRKEWAISTCSFGQKMRRKVSWHVSVWSHS